MPEPTYDFLDEVKGNFEKYELDCFIGIGGGSTIDLSKGLATLKTNKKNAIYYRGFGKVIERPLPVIAIPTTAGSGSEVTPYAVFIDTEAAELGDRGGSRGWNIDPYVNSVIIATEESELDKYTPFLNGHIELNKGFEVQGWMIFDIPRSIKPLTIWWRESDDIVIDLPK